MGGAEVLGRIRFSIRIVISTTGVYVRGVPLRQYPSSLLIISAKNVLRTSSDSTQFKILQCKHLKIPLLYHQRRSHSCRHNKPLVGQTGTMARLSMAARPTFSTMVDFFLACVSLLSPSLSSFSLLSTWKPCCFSRDNFLNGIFFLFTGFRWFYFILVLVLRIPFLSLLLLSSLFGVCIDFPFYQSSSSYRVIPVQTCTENHKGYTHTPVL